MTSVGRGSFTLAKQTTAKWDRLLSSKDKPKNVHVWWAMQEKYDVALDALKNKPSTDSLAKDKKSDQAESVSQQSETQKEEDDVTKGWRAAKKRLQDEAKKAKRQIEEQATSRKAKLQKQIEDIEEEESSSASKVDSSLKSAISKLDERFGELMKKRDSGESVSWNGEKDEHYQSFFQSITSAVKSALGMEEPQVAKDEI